jgi:hypothetical protein
MHQGGVTRRWVPDALGLAWTVAAVVAVMAPVLRPGVHLGSFDLLSRIGLTRHGGVAVHSQFPADQVLYFVPLTNLAWHQVHSGHLPLWNPYNVLGVPLAFTWQSGVFGVPLLLSYLAPLHWAYTVIVLSKLVIAGTGAYALCRVLGAGPLGAAFAGTVFELSGPMVHYSGWAMTSVTCWGGWILAAAVLLVRGEHRRRHGVLLALAVAAAVYGGHPESLVVLGLSLAVFVAVVLALGARRPRSVRRPLVDLMVAGACGVGLGAPLILPGLQVVQASGRAAASGGAAFSLTHLTDLLTGLQGTDFRVPSPYLGVLAVVLAVVAVRLLWGRPEILGLGAVAVVGLVLTFRSPISAAVQGAPAIGQITWNRDIMMVALAVAVLGGMGVDALVRGRLQAPSGRFVLWALAGAAVVVGGVALAVATGTQKTGGGGPRAMLGWAGAAVAAAVGLVLVSGVGRGDGADGAARARRRGLAGTGLLVVQTVVLVLSGVSFWSISGGSLPVTPAVRALERTVGSSVVAIGSCRPRPFSYPYSTEVGIRPNANVGYGVHEFAVYEPALPKSYYTSWEAVSGQQLAPSLRRVGLFCPQITTAAEARLYGIGYVLEAAHSAGPRGAQRVGTIGGEELFHVAGAAPATLSALPDGRATLPDDAPGTPVPATHPDPASWRVATDAASRSLLRVRVTALPGWSATIDGRPLALSPWAAGAMLEARVPGGHHVVELHYWPTAFSAGLAVAALVVTGGVGLLGAGVVRRGAGRARGASGRPGGVPPRRGPGPPAGAGRPPGP